MQSHVEAQQLADAQAMAERGDRWYIAGAVVCGTWVLGPIGVIFLL
jgi:hypothetical protein